MNYSRRPFRAVLLIGIVGVVTALLTSCGKGPAQVVISDAQPGVVSITAGGSGVVGSALDVPIVLGYRGTVTTVDVVAGQGVRAGQPLFGVSSASLENAAGKLGARYHALLATLGQLQRTGAASTAIAAVRAQAEVAGNLFTSASASREEIRAPVSGTVALLGVGPGSKVLPDQVLAHLLDISRLTVSAEMPTSFLGRVKVGMSASVRSAAAVGSTFHGVVTAVSPVVSPSGKTFAVVLALHSPPATVVPGVSAYVAIPLTIDATVAVNSLAVLNTDAAPIVFIVQGATVRQQNVAVGVTDGSVTEVLSGVSVGDQLVIAGAQSLSDGSSVTVSAP